MARPVIALLSDFGLRDHYVAAMKAVILGICPDAALLDISHEIPAQDILAGALELEAIVSYLPAGTIVVAVVDPGVGSGRRGVAIEAGDIRFVGPDNGLFSLALARLPRHTAVSIEERRFALNRVSRTFEGRDRFAPAAAWLACGAQLFEMGPAVADLVELKAPAATRLGKGIDGVVIRVDHFGNLITNIDDEELAALGNAVSIDIAGATIDGVAGNYADVAHGALCAVIGSTGRLEISVNGGSAAAVLNASRGTSAHVRLRSGA
jgi:S-adenosyl-L-methionine hydrolase (adenosine-forming)